MYVCHMLRGMHLEMTIIIVVQWFATWWYVGLPFRYNLITVSVYHSGGLMFLVYSGIVLFHWFYCSGLFGFAVLVYFGSIVSVSSSGFIRTMFQFD